MRKLYMTCITLLFAFTFYTAHGQEPVNKITHNYFRSDPFVSDFSSFLTHLLNDPGITDKTIQKRTDTSYFYFKGTYTTHNPFFFKPKRVEIMLSEAEVKIKDSVVFDTIYLYQLFAYNDNTESGVKEVKKEFDKIHKRYKGAFSKNSVSENSAGSKLNWVTYNFFVPFYAVAPFAVSWLGPDENKEMCLLLTIRMNSSNNKAVLPIPFNAL